MLFHYNIEYWDDFDKESKIKEGIVAAVDMGSAVNRVVEFYGADNVGSITIYELEDVLAYEDLYEMVK